MVRSVIQCMAIAASLMLGGVAAAGSVGDFENAMRRAYGDYRSALFLTNISDRDGAADAIASFEEKWSALISANPIPPPQYADDRDFERTLEAIAAIADRAATEIASGELVQAHETLEGIRDQIGGLHERNGIIAFSDRMNAYHIMMEKILAGNYDNFSIAGLGALREDVAVLAYLAEDIAAHPPRESENPAYEPLLEGLTASVASLLEATRSGDAAAARQAVNGLKAPYAKFFLKFG